MQVVGQRLEPGRAVLACRAVELGLHAGEQLLVNGASDATGGLLVASAVLHGAGHRDGPGPPAGSGSPRSEPIM
jgi:hypothetical protein